MKKTLLFISFIIIFILSLTPFIFKNNHTNIKSSDQNYDALLKSNNFNLSLKDEYFKTYDTLKNDLNNNYNITTLTLNKINYPNFLSAYNDTKQYLIINNIPLVNRIYGLDKDFIPNNLVKVENVDYIKRDNEIMLLNKEALNAYQQLYNMAKTKNINLTIFSAYRSYEKQATLWAKSLDPNNKFLALPGHSEHQTGLAIDVSTREIGLTNHLFNTKVFQFLKQNAHKFGFIIRYPENKSNITGYFQEAWHLRYVGDIAEEIYNSNLCLEEYLYYNYEIPIFL